MDFVDQHGRTILTVSDLVEELNWPMLDEDVICVNLAEGLKDLRNLRRLYYSISRRQARDEIEPLRGLDHLTVFGASSFGGAQDLAPLTTCTGLRTMRLIGMNKIDVSPVAEMTWLEELMLDGSTRNLRAIGKLTNLRTLVIQFNKSVTLKWYAGMTRLTELRLKSSRISDLDSMRLFPELLKLTITNTNFDSLAPLSENRKLVTLEADYCRRLGNLAGIERLEALTRLDVDDLKHVPTLRPLRSLRNLRTLLMADTEVDDHDLSPLLDLPHLEEVVLGPYYGDHLTEIARRMPRCSFKIVGRHAGGLPYEIHGPVEIFQDIERNETTFRIDQDLTDLLSVETNDEAEERIQDAIEQEHPDLLPSLQFDSEGEAFVALSPSPDALRVVAKCINDLTKPPRGPRRPGRGRASPKHP